MQRDSSDKLGHGGSTPSAMRQQHPHRASASSRFWPWVCPSATNACSSCCSTLS